MHLTLRQLEIFIAIADAGSTMSASGRLALSQSAVSGALGDLEHLLGVQLFDRIGRRLVLNDVGRALIPEVRAILQAVQQIEKRFSIGSSAPSKTRSLPAHITLGASTTIGNYLVPHLIATYLERYQHTTFDIHIDNTLQISKQVEQLTLDLALIEGHPHNSNLKIFPWFKDELIIVCARSHPYAQDHIERPKTVEELRAAKWLVRETGSGTREAVEQLLLPYLHNINIFMYLGSSEAIKRAAAEGLGLACLSRSVVADLIERGELVEIRTTLPPLGRMLYLICHAHKWISSAMQNFINHCGIALDESEQFTP